MPPRGSPRRSIPTMLYNLYSILCFSLLILPLIAISYLIKEKINTPSLWLLSTILTAVASYVILLIAVSCIDQHLENALYTHDLNGDREFSGDEITPEMKQAMQKFTTDTGRTLAPITGLFTCPIYSAFWHGLIGVPYLLIRKAKQDQASHMTAGSR